MRDLLVDNKDLLSLAVSLAALAISLVIAQQNLKTTRQIATDASAHALQMARATTYQRLHEMLVDPKAAAGRRRLFQAANDGKFPSLGDAEWDEINYSLALYDTLAGYVYRQHVDEEVVLDSWHHPLSNIAQPTRDFMRHREKQSVKQPWAHLLQLLEQAERYPCRCPAPVTLGKVLDRP